jgi:hypothetical protein
MKNDIILSILFILICQFSFTFQFEDLSLISSLNKETAPQTSSFLQSKVKKDIDSTESSVSSSQANDTSEKEINKTGSNETSIFNRSSCEELEKYLIDMVNIDNLISQLRVSFQKKTVSNVKFELKEHITDEEKKKFKEDENLDMVHYVNKVNELSALIDNLKSRLLELKDKKCQDLSENSIEKKLDNTATNLHSFIELISQDLKELKLDTKFLQFK